MLPLSRRLSLHLGQQLLESGVAGVGLKGLFGDSAEVFYLLFVAVGVRSADCLHERCKLAVS